MENLLQTLLRLDKQVTPLCGCVGAKHLQEYVLLFHEKARDLALGLRDCARSRFTLSETNWGHFNDGTDQIINKTMQDKKKADGAFTGLNVLFIASLHNNADTLSQLHFLHYICSQQRPATITILMPFFPTSTMERIGEGEEGYVPTAATLASMFSNLPFQGGVRVMTYDVHVLGEKFYFYGNATLTTHTAIPLLMQELEKNGINCIVFPDDGAKKRFEKIFNPGDDDKKYTVVCCTKEHVKGSDEKKVKLEGGVEGLIRGNNTIIVDDLTRSGSTLFQCMDAIIESGALSVSMFVTHGAFLDKFWVTLKNHQTKPKKIYTTDSISGIRESIISHDYGIEPPRGISDDTKLFKVLSLVPRIYNDLNFN